jgi:hypothetical protein
MNRKSTVQKEQLQKLAEVTETFRASEYRAVISPIQDNAEYQFVGSMLIQLQRLEEFVISDLMEADEDVEDEIEGCVVGNLMKWSEIIGHMVRILEASRDRAWGILDEIDSSSAEKAELIG